MDEQEFRRLTGGDPLETAEEAEARKERFERGEETLGDVVEGLGEALKRAQDHNLGLHG